MIDVAGILEFSLWSWTILGRRVYNLNGKGSSCEFVCVGMKMLKKVCISNELETLTSLFVSVCGFVNTDEKVLRICGRNVQNYEKMNSTVSHDNFPCTYRIVDWVAGCVAVGFRFPWLLCDKYKIIM